MKITEELLNEMKIKDENFSDGLIKPDGDYAQELRSLWPDGTIRWLEARGRVESDAAGQLVLRYVPADNPNGAVADVAGVCDATGRVLGLMPHPERHIDPTQHPRWTRGEAGTTGDGLKMFQNAVAYFS